MLAISYETFQTPHCARKSGKRTSLGFACSAREAMARAARLRTAGKRVRVVKISDAVVSVTGEPAFTIAYLRKA